MDINQVKQLIEKYNAGFCDEQEKALLETWYLEHEASLQEDLSPEMLETAVDRVWNKLEAAYQPEMPVRKISLVFRWMAAASVLIVITLGGYLLIRKSPPPVITTQNTAQDLAPGKHQATLTLTNGEKILLTNTLSGNIAQQGNTKVIVNADNAVVYHSASADQSISYNTLSTQKGEQSPFPLILADGSKVWLNAASSITFPVSFTGKERRIKLSGEAYIEVAHKENQPFIVVAGNQVIEDLGTHFNVKAYDDEPGLRTTLIEGSIRVSNGSKSALLKPGQQSDVFKGSNNIIIKTANIEEAIAWKSGRFHFDHADIQTVMREFARWYNVDVKFPEHLPSRAITGNIDRNSNASVSLQILKILGINYQINHKTIIIIPDEPK